MIEQFDVLIGGACKQVEKWTNREKPFKIIQFPAHFFYIKHSKKGHILIDTGYSDYFFKETKTFPYSLYRKITPLSFSNHESAKHQLERLGVKASDVRYIFITHFHGDHIAGLKDFPNAIFICSKKAYESVKNLVGLKAVRNGFIPGFLPKDFLDRVKFLEEGPTYQEKVKSSWRLAKPGEPVFDVFGDGSLLSVDLSGHANGQMGVYMSYRNRNIWLIADAAWDSDGYRKNSMPTRLGRLVLNNYKEFKRSLLHIHDFAKKNQDVWIVPSHCREVEDQWKKMFS